MKIIKTAAMQESEALGAPVAPTGGGFRPPMRAPQPAPAPQQPSQADFEFTGEQDEDMITEAINEQVGEHANVFGEGHDYPGHGGGYHDMGDNYELDSFSFTVKAVAPMTGDDLPFSFRGVGQAPSSNGRGSTPIHWQAQRQMVAPDTAKYDVSEGQPGLF